MLVHYLLHYFLLGILLSKTVSAFSLKSQPEYIYAKVLYVTNKDEIQNTDIDEQRTYSGGDVVKTIGNSAPVSRSGNTGVLIPVSGLCSTITVKDPYDVDLMAIFESDSNCSLTTQLTNLRNAQPAVTGAIVYSPLGYIPDDQSVLSDQVDVAAYYVTKDIADELINLRKRFADNSSFIGVQLVVALYPSSGSISMILEVTFIGILVTVFFAFGLSYRFRVNDPTTTPQTTLGNTTQSEKLDKSILDTFPTRKFVAVADDDDAENKADTKSRGNGGNVHKIYLSDSSRTSNSSNITALLEQRENGKGARENRDGPGSESETDISFSTTDLSNSSGDSSEYPSENSISDNQENENSRQSLPPNTEQPGSTLDTLSASEKIIQTASNPKEETTTDIVVPFNDEKSQVDPKKESDSSYVPHVHVHMISNTTCAICLDDFVEGDEVRCLPCEHEYHTECIDPWLTEKSSKCPLCKFDCRPPKVLDESDSTADNDQSSSASSLSHQ
ncbi:4184_t:CDS:2 [Paraglomus occultum]|uniref:4184_t:CDS:1 n=1 Tax=Paraglomus occultum TaxID=144539 RepID=A0A9N9FRH2_9GLOM|nr:4184_t:CDS:2 [Paraglomus occultum]